MYAVLIRLLARRGHVSGEWGARNKRATLRSECGDAKLRNDGREEILSEVHTDYRFHPDIHR